MESEVILAEKKIEIHASFCFLMVCIFHVLFEEPSCPWISKLHSLRDVRVEGQNTGVPLQNLNTQCWGRSNLEPEKQQFPFPNPAGEEEKASCPGVGSSSPGSGWPWIPLPHPLPFPQRDKVTPLHTSQPVCLMSSGLGKN